MHGAFRSLWQVIEGLDWVKANYEPPAVVVMALGGTACMRWTWQCGLWPWPGSLWLWLPATWTQTPAPSLLQGAHTFKLYIVCKL